MAPVVEQFETRQLLTGGMPITFVVNTLGDTIDTNPSVTSLREAVLQANAQTGQDVIIQLMPGTHTLTINGENEEAAATGDLDIASAVSVTIRGAANGMSVIDANFSSADRVFDIASGNFVTIEGVTIKDGQRDSGGAIDNAGQLTVVRTTFFNNRGDTGTDPVRGGAIHNTGSLFVLASTFDSNTTTGEGGAIYNSGSAFIDASTFFSNDADGSGNNHGGAIYNASSGSLNVQRSTFEDNTAGASVSGDGGAIFTAGSAGIDHSTFSANMALNGSGGAIAVASSGSLFLTASTVTLNTALFGGGVDFNGGMDAALVQNTIIAQNTAPDDGFRDVRRQGANPFTSLGFNLIGISLPSGSGFTNGVNGDQVGTTTTPIDPMLGALALNGGPTKTHRPLVGSTAIDGGTLPNVIGSALPITDQRGAPLRAPAIVADIGAVETGTNAVFVNTLNDTPDANVSDGIIADAAGNISLRAALHQNNFTVNVPVIVLLPGIFLLDETGTNEDNGASGDLDVNFATEIIGFGPLATIIDGAGIDRVFDLRSFSAETLIESLTVQHGVSATDSGGGIRNAGRASLNNVHVRENQAVNGGGIFSSFDLNLDGVFIADNFADGEGGGIANGGRATIRNSFIVRNFADDSAGGIGHVSSFDLLEIDSSTIRDNSTNGDAGGIGNEGTMIVRDSNITGNSAVGRAGGIGSVGNTTLLRSNVDGNFAGGDAGGVGASSGTLNISGSFLTNNSAGANGGGLGISGSTMATVNYSEFDGNRALSGAGGGAFVGSGSVTIGNSAIVNNMAGQTGIAFGDGGGLYVTGGTTALSNSTVSGNTAIQFNSNGGAGGGVTLAGGTLSVTHATITNNTAALGGGLATIAPPSGMTLFNPVLGHGTVQNTIIAENIASLSGTDVFAATNTAASLGHNLIGVAGSGSGGPIFVDNVNNDQVGTSGSPLDPQLGALAFNGGLTRTHALQAGSPAIDSSSTIMSVASEQRGAPRVINGGMSNTADIGAYEFGFDGIFVNTTQDIIDGGDGVTSLREAIIQANATAGTQTIVLLAGVYKLTRFGTGEDLAATGDLDITDDVNIRGYGSESTTIDGIDSDRLFDVSSGGSQTELVLSDLSLTHGKVMGFGGGNEIRGGAIRSVGSHIELHRVSVTNNFASGFGGAIYAQDGSPVGTVIATDSVFMNNTSGDSGGAIAVRNDVLNLTNTRFEFNTAMGNGGGGGALLILDSSATVQGSLFKNNTGEFGGAVSVDTFGSPFTKTVSFSNSQFSNNSGQYGGGIANVSQDLFVSGSVFNANSAQFFGGGLYNFSGVVAVNGTDFIGNQTSGGGSGGAIDNTGAGATLTLTGSTLDSGFANTGGGLHNTATANVFESTISTNTGNTGGGISNEGTLTIRNSTISTNTSSSEGGGLHNTSSGTATITNATFALNISSDGGGISNDNVTAGAVTLQNTLVATNSTFSNSPNADLSGSFTSNAAGGNNLIGDRDGATGFTNGTNGDIVGGVTSVAITNATSTNPIQITTTGSHGLMTGDRVRVTGVGGLFVANGTFTVTVTSTTTFTLNDSFGSGNGTYTTGGQVFELVNPLLDVLRDNNLSRFAPPLTPIQFGNLPPVVTQTPRRSTFTHELLLGSPAIDAGMNTGPQNTDRDQRGEQRVDGNNDTTVTRDIGAFELAHTTVSGLAFSDANGNGLFDVATEFRRADVTVFVDSNGNGQQDDFEPFANPQMFDNPLTPQNEFGTYTLELVRPGQQVIGHTTPLNTRPTAPNDPRLSSPSTVASGNTPRSVVTADFNGDSLLDFAYVDQGTDQVVIQQRGHEMPVAGFVTQAIAVGSMPVDVVAGDIDQDGRVDLVVANFGNDTLTVLFNLGNDAFGNAQFGQAVTLTAGDGPISVVIADLNHDFQPDIAVANTDSNNVVVFANTGSRTFAAGIGFGVSSTPRQLVAADFDGDGLTDLAVAAEGTDSVRFLFNLNPPTGFGFNSGTSVTFAGSTQPQSLATADFDQDGDVDLVVGGFAELFRVANLGNRNFSAPTSIATFADPRDIDTVDIDGDGDQDVVAVSVGAEVVGVFEFENGTFVSSTSFPTGSEPTGIAVGEFSIGESYSRPDILTANSGDGTVRLLTNLLGSAVVTGVVGMPTMNQNFGVQPLATISGNVFNDLNANGEQFGAFSADGGLPNISLFLDTNGNGRFDSSFEPTALSASFSSFDTGVGDYVFRNLIPGSYRVFALPPIGSIVTGPVVAPTDSVLIGTQPSNAADILVDDVDLDGLNDVLVLRRVGSDTGFRVLRNTGSGFSLLSNLTFAGAGLRLEAGDFDNDGDNDVVITRDPSASAGDGVIDFIRNDRTAFAFENTVSLNELPTDIAVGDINGDMVPDVVVSTLHGTQSVTILTHVNLFTFTSATLAAGTEVRGIALAFLDANGTLDLVASDVANNRFKVFGNNGNGVFLEASTTTTANDPGRVYVSDLAASAALDIVVTSRSSPSLQIHIGNGTLAFNSGSPLSPAVPGIVRDLAAVDYDHDGLKDIVIADGDGVISVLRGFANGVFEFSQDIKATPEDSANVMFDLGEIDPNDSAQFLDVATVYDLSVNAEVRIGFTRLNSHLVEVDPGESVSGQNFGVVQTATLQGLTFTDLDEDGRLDPGEPAQPGVTVFVDRNLNGALDAFEPVAMSDSNGMYFLPGVRPQDMSIVRELVVGNLSPTGPINAQFPGATTLPGVGSQSSPSSDLVAVGDLDLDGDEDIVRANPNSDSISIFLFDSLTGTHTRTDITVGDNPSAVLIGNITGTGAPEIYVLNRGSDSVSVFEFSTQFLLLTTLVAGDDPGTLAIFDFDDFDGNVTGELAITSTADSFVRFYKANITTGNLVPAALVSVAGASAGDDISFGRFDSGSTIDYALLDTDNDRVVFVMNNGDGTVSPLQSVTVGDQPVALSAGFDIDGDGDLDLAVAIAGDGGKFQILRNDNGTFVAETAIAVGGTPSDIEVGFVDNTFFNNDSQADVVVTLSDANRILIFERIGSVFSSPNIAVVSGPQDSLAVGQIAAGFGSPDIVTSQPGTGAVSLSVNRSSHIPFTYLVNAVAGETVTGLNFGSVTPDTEVSLVGNDLKITDINGGTSDDDLTLRVDETNGVLVISSVSSISTTIAGATGNGTNTVTVLLSSFANGKIIVDSLAGFDRLGVDFSTGNFMSEIEYLGGDPAGPDFGDILILFGGNFTNATFNFENAADGTIELSGNATISYSGLELVNLDSDNTNATLNYGDGSNSITVDGVFGGLITEVTSSDGAQMLFEFNPSGSLTINAGNGNDTITAAGFSDFFRASLTLDGQGGEDSISLGADLVLGSETSAGNLSITAELIDLSATSIATDGDETNDDAGSVTFNGAVLLGNDLAIFTDASASDGAVTFTNSLNAASSGQQSLTVFRGSGSLSLQAVGTTTALQSLSVIGSGQATLGGNIFTDTSGGSGAVNLSGAQIVLGTSVVIDTEQGDDGNAGAVLLGAAVSSGQSNAQLNINTQTGGAFNAGHVTLAAFGNAGGFFVPNLFVNTLADSGTDGTVNFTGPVTLANNGFLSVDAGTITLSNSADLAVSGTGLVNFISYRNIVLSSGSSITSADGNIVLWTVVNASGDFSGIVLDGASVTSTGSGNITVDGRSGDSASQQHGVVLLNNALLDAAGSGQLSVTGQSQGSGGTDNDGVRILSGSDVRSNTGALFVEGYPGGGGNSQAVVIADDTGTSISTTNAPIEIFAVILSLGANNSSITAGSGNSVSLLTSSAPINLGTSSDSSFGLSDAQLDRIIAGTLIIGDGDAGTITISDAITRSASTNFFFLTSTGNDLVFSGSTASLDANGGGVQVSLDPSGDGQIISGNATTDIHASLLILFAGTGEIGASGNPLAFDAEMLFSNSINSNQFFSEANSVTTGPSPLFAGTGTITLASGTFLTLAPILSPVTVASGATLGGIGPVIAAVTVQNGGTVAPGNSPGVLNTGNISFNSGSNFIVEVNGTRPGADHDQLNVNGTVSLGGATLSTSGTITSVPGQTIVLINNDGTDAVSGTFNGLSDGATVTINGINFFLSYYGGSNGNDVTLTQAGGPLTFNDDDGAADTFTIRLIGGTVQVLNAATLLASTPAAATTGITINGEDDRNDLLVLDFTSGSLLPSGGVTFHGGANGNDSLTLTGGTLASVTHNFTNANDGSVAINGSTAVNYDGLEPITDNLNAIDRVFTFNGGAESITLTDDTVGSSMTIDSDLSESVTFNSPTGSLTINAGSGDDTVTVNSVDATYNASLTINGDAGSDLIDLNTSLSLGSTTSAGNLSLIADSINLNAASIATDGDTTNGDAGNVSLTGTIINIDSNLTIDTNASNTDGTLTVTGAIDAVTSGTASLTLDVGTTNVSLNNAANDLDSVSVASGNNVVLNDANAIDLRTSTVGGNLTVTSLGDITDSGNLTVAGTTSLSAGANNITLDNATNDFNGAVSVTGVNVVLNDANAIDLGTSTVGGNLTISAGGNITDSGNLTVTGLTSLTAGANNITLNNNNNFGTISVASGNNVVLNEASATDLGTSTVSGNLSVTSSGSITDSGNLTVAGTTSLSAGATNNIILDIATNDFAGAVSVGSGNNVTLNDANAIELGNSTVSGNLTVTAGGDVTGSGSLAIAGTTSVTAGPFHDISFANATNDFIGTVSVSSGDDVVLNDANAIELGTVTVGDTLSVTAGGAITDAANADISVAGSATFSGSSITLGDTGSDTFNAGSVTFNSAGAVAITEDSNLDVTGASTAGGATLNAGAGAITISTTLAVSANALSLTADEIDLTGGANSVTGTSTLMLQSSAAATSIGIGGGAGTLDLNDTDLAALANGFNLITIGRSDATGLVTVESSTFTDSVTIIGGSIAVTELNVGSNIVALIARTGAITDGGDAGTDVTGISLIAMTQTGIGSNLDVLSTAVSNLEAVGGSGGVYVSNSGGLTIGGIGAIVGVSATGGDIAISASSPLTVNEDVVNSGGGNVSLSAAGNSAADDLTLNANVTASGGNGAITLNAASDILQTAGTVSAAGSGAVDLNAGTNTADGVITMSSGTAMSSASGTITLSADGTATLRNLTSTSGNIAVTAGDVVLNDMLSSSGTLTLAPATAGSTIGIGGGTGAFNLSDAELGLLVDGFSSITIGDAANGTGAVDVDSSTFTDPLTIVGGSLAVTELNAGANSVTLTARTGAITDGGDVATDVTGGAATLNSATGVGAAGDKLSTRIASLTASASTSGGIFINEFNSLNLNTLTVAANGNVDIATGNGTLQLVAGASIATTGTGTISLTSDRNILLSAGSSLSTVNGNLTVVANQGESGTTSGNFVGIDVNGAAISSTNGDILLAGLGGNSGSNNRGILLQNAGASVSTTGTGTITLNGTGGSGGTGNTSHVGVLAARFSQISAVNGAIDIYGASNATTGLNQGVVINGTLTSTGSAPITIDGTGASGTGGNYGVAISQFSSVITSGSGPVSVTAQGGLGSGNLNIGALFDFGGFIESTGTSAATITVNGTGGSGGSINQGFRISGGGSFIRSSAANISITGAGQGSGTDNEGIILGSGLGAIESTGAGTVTLVGTTTSTSSVAFRMSSDAEIKTSAGNAPISIAVDSAAIAATSTITAGTSGIIAIRQATTGTAINLGSAVDSNTGTLELSEAELDRVTAGTLNIGNTNTGSITITDALTRTAATNLTLTTAGNNSLAFSGANGSLDANGGDVTIALDVSGLGSVTSGTAATDIFADSLSITNGSNGIGANGNPLTFNANDLTTNTATGNGSQFLSEVNSVSVLGLTAGTGTVRLNSGTFQTSNSNVIADATSLSLGHQAALDLNNHDETISALALEIGTGNGADVTTGTGTLTLGGNVTLTAINLGAIGATITGKLNLGGASRTISVADGNAANDLTISADISGSGVGLTKTGPGTLTLAGNNTYTGTTDIKSGALLVNGSLAASSNVIVNDGIQPLGSNSSEFPNLNLVASGPVVLPRNDDGSTGALPLGFTFNFFGTNYSTFFINNNGNVTFVSPVSDFDPAGFPQDIPILAPFWADVDTRNVLSGEVRLASGTTAQGHAFIQVDWPDVGYFPSQANLVNDFTLYVEDDPAGDIVAFIYRNMEWTTGSASDGSGGFGGSGAQIGFDSGDGLNFISLGRPAASADLDPFRNSQYVFRINASGVPEFGNGAQLGGTGTVNGPVTVNLGGHVAPGTSPGILNTGNFDLRNGASLNIDLNGALVGTQYDQLNVTGSVKLAGQLLLTSAMGFATSPGDTFVIINNDSSDSVIGRFQGLPQGALLSVGNADFHIFYNHIGGGDGNANDVALIANRLPVVNDQMFSIAENNGPGTVVGSVVATDADSPVTFAITGGNTNNVFAINQLTGQITVNNASALDFERNPVFNLTVAVTDDAQATDTATITINVTNIAPSVPVDANPAPNLVSERDLNGTPVGITASSNDIHGGTVTYTFNSLADSANGRFAIGLSSGIVTLADANQINPVTTYTITVRATDGTDTSSQTFTIAALFDTPSTPVDADGQNNTIPEGAVQGSRVGVTVSSLDGQGDDVFYQLTDDAGGRFAIDPQTGVVTVKTSNLLKFSQATQHTILARAIDAEGNATPVVPFVINLTQVLDTAPPIASILPTRIAVIEGNSGFNFVLFEVYLNKKSALPVTIDFTTRRGDDPNFILPEGITSTASFASDGTLAMDPLGPRDFFQSSGRLTFAPGIEEQTLRIQIRPDNLPEMNEFFFVQLRSPVNATLAPQQSVAIAQIVDDDSVPQLVVSNSQVLEGDTPNQNRLVFTVSLVGNLLLDTNGQPLPTSVEFATGNPAIDTAFDGSNPANADYTAVAGILSFTNSNRVQTVEVPILGDLAIETDETFSLRFSNPMNLGLSNSEATGTILNDDDNAAVLSITPESTSIREGDAGTQQQVNLTVTLVGKPTNPVTVNFQTVDLSATAGKDYTAVSGQLTFQPGEITKTITVTVFGDGIVDPDKVFNVVLSLPQSMMQPNVSFGFDRSTSTIVIRNDDQAILTEEGDNLSDQLNLAFDNNGAVKSDAMIALLRQQALDFIAANGLTNYILIVIDPVDFVLTDPQNRSSGFTESTGVVNQIPGTYYSGDGNVEVLVVPLPPAGTYNVQLVGLGGDFHGSITVVEGTQTKTTPVSQSLNGDLATVAVQVGNSTNGPIPVGLGLAAAKSGDNSSFLVASAFGQRDFNNLVAQLFQNLPLGFLDELNPPQTLTEEEIQERAANLLKKLDKNNDNMITADEVGEEDWKTLRQSDKNGDGRITLEELQDQIRANTVSKPKSPIPGANGPRLPQQNPPQNPQGNREGTKAKPTTFERNRSTPPASPNKTDKSSQPPAQPDAGKGQGKTTQISRPGNDDSRQANVSRPWWHLFLPWSEKNSTTKSQDTRNV